MGAEGFENVMMFLRSSLIYKTIVVLNVTLSQIDKGVSRMPWTMDNYPSSLKNLDKAVRKKAIEISNALVQDGYDEGEAIPIATSQAKEWVSNATKKGTRRFFYNMQRPLRAVQHRQTGQSYSIVLYL